MTTRGDNIEKSAGCIIFREDPVLGTCVLLLQTYDKFDLPKGHIEKKDGSIFDAAARETYEECGFRIINDPDAELDVDEPVAKILQGADTPIECYNVNQRSGAVKKIVYLFPTVTLCSRATLLPNEKSGILEHQSYKWQPVGNLSQSRLHPYLLSGVNDALSLYNVHALVGRALKSFKSP